MGGWIKRRYENIQSPLERELGLTYFRAIPVTINTDVPRIAKNLRLVPVGLEGPSTTPQAWEPKALQQAYQTLVRNHLLQFEKLSNKDVKYSELSRKLEQGNLVLEVEVQNLSMQRDLNLQPTGVFASHGGSHGGSGWPMFLAADGRYIGDGRALADWKDITNPHFDWGERKVLPPGFKTQGKLVLPLYGTSPTAKYVFLDLRLPGRTSGWRLLDIPNN